MINLIYIIVLSFVEMAHFLINKIPSGAFLLSAHFNQDPIESFFGQQRAHGGSSDNPNSKTFLYNAQTIRVQRTMAVHGNRENVQRQKRSLVIDDYDSLKRPLSKHPQH